MLLGAIADDLTGATDLALMLTRAGMKTLQVMRMPEDKRALRGFDAVVFAMKTRTCPPDEAVAASLAACDALVDSGAQQVYFKYCSTFDSTDKGNIGPVADALLDHLDADLSVVCPAFPTNKRTIYRGHLFVGDQLLSDSPMKDHPLTPMRDSNLVRLMARQSRYPVGLVSIDTVREGCEAIEEAFAAARKRGERYLVLDALTDEDMLVLGLACRYKKLVTAGSGLALGLPQNFIARGLMSAKDAPTEMKAPDGRAAILAGSCSEATREQIRTARETEMPAYKIDPRAVADGSVTADGILSWAKRAGAEGPVLIYSSANPQDVAAAQAALGREKAGHIIEELLAAVAQGLVKRGVTKLLVAGGETSGAIVTALGIDMLEIGPEIDPGVPWTRAIGHNLVLALKSGNFGAPDFFLKAWDRLS